MNFDLVCKKPPLDFEIQYLGKQVTATLYYLADEGRMLKVSSVFDIGKSTMSKVIRRVTQTMSKYLGNKHIALPTNQK